MVRFGTLYKMSEEDFEIAIKVVIVGNGAVGKSSMIQRYCKGIFTRDYKKTIGVDFLERELDYDGEEIRLMLWDTAGQEEFDAITKTYYRGAQACVLAFSTTDRVSFDAIETWKKKVENEVGDIPMVLVQNKIDLLDQAQITEYEVEKIAEQLNMRLYRTSVKENFNIDNVFEYLMERYFFDLNTRMIEESKQAVSIGPSLLSSAHLTAQKAAAVQNSKPNKHQRMELINMDQRSNRNKHSSLAENKRKEKCLIT